MNKNLYIYNPTHMTFTKLESGQYSFKGIDNWTNKEIEGHILHQPFDVKLSQQWQVVFGLGTKDVNTAYFGKSLKDCKKWLTN